MAAFPSYGILLAAGFSEQRKSIVLRTDMENGPPKQRRTASRQMVTRTVTYQFTDAEYSTFLTWYTDTIYHGADWFDWTDPRTGNTISARLVNGQLGQAVPLSGMDHWRQPLTIESWD